VRRHLARNNSTVSPLATYLLRVENDPISHSFAQRLLNIGHGNAGAESEQNRPRSVEIPCNMVCRDEDDLIDSIYSSMNDSVLSLTPDYFQERVILAPLNNSVHTLNANVLEVRRLSNNYSSKPRPQTWRL
jgi:PIF1-like helicase